MRVLTHIRRLRLERASGFLKRGHGSVIEFYLNDPETTEPEDLLTEICIPLLSR